MVDAPGYGYAKVSKKQRKKFGLMMESYLKERANLKQVFLLVDFRLKLSEADIMMYKFLKHYKLPVTFVATKADKVGIANYQKQRKLILDDLDLVMGDEFLVFSSVTKEGREAILDKIERTIIV